MGEQGQGRCRGLQAPHFILPSLLCLILSVLSGTNQGIALDLIAGDLATAGTEFQPLTYALPG